MILTHKELQFVVIAVVRLQFLWLSAGCACDALLASRVDSNPGHDPMTQTSSISILSLHIVFTGRNSVTMMRETIE